MNKTLKGIADALRRGSVGILPTDTIYGLVGSVLSRKSVAKVYRLRKRNFKKPMIILIANFRQLAFFKPRMSARIRHFLKKLWPNKVSVILSCPSKKFQYLNRGTKTLAFRMPKDKFLLQFLKRSGPLVAPSANIEGEKPASTIQEAFDYFGNKVDFYIDARILHSKPSTLIKIEGEKVVVVRRGAATAPPLYSENNKHKFDMRHPRVII